MLIAIKKKYPLHKYISLILLFGIFTIACSHQEKQASIELRYEQTDTLLNLSEINNCISIQNNSSQLITIQFQLNNKFWFTKELMLNAIKSMPNDSIEGISKDAANAWVFVMQNTYHYQKTPIPKPYRYAPSTFINSFGGGLCSNRNASLSHIWDAMQYQSRCFQLNGHLVSEVFDTNKWKMMDADFNRYFITHNGEIAGCRKLEDSIEYYTMRYYSNAATKKLFPSIYYPTNYYQLFTTKEDNEFQDWYLQGVLWEDMYLSLPPNATIEFPCINPQDSLSNYTYGKIQIPEHFLGYINMPFVIHHIENSTLTGPYLINPHTSNTMNVPGKYFVLGNNCTIYYYINAILTTLGPSNILTIKKDASTHLKTQLLPNFSTNSAYQQLKQTAFDLNQLNQNIDKIIRFRTIVNSDYNNIIISNDSTFTISYQTLYREMFNTFGLSENIIKNIQFTIELLNDPKYDKMKFFSILSKNEYYYQLGFYS
jgi:hypothetical protein